MNPQDPAQNNNNQQTPGVPPTTTPSGSQTPSFVSDVPSPFESNKESTPVTSPLVTPVESPALPLTGTGPIAQSAPPTSPVTPPVTAPGTFKIPDSAPETPSVGVTPVPTQAPAPSVMPPVDMTPPPPPVAVTPAPTVPPPPQTPPSSTFVAPEKSSRLPRVLLFLILLLVVVGAGFLIFSFISNRAGTSEKTVTVWGLWEEPETMQPLLTAYQEANPKVKVVYEKKSKEDYRERVTNALAQGQGPDVFLIHNSWVPMFKTTLSTIPSSVMTPQEYAQTFYPVMSTDLNVGTGFVGIPSGYDGLALFVNDEIFSTYGKTPPQTWNELRDTALELTIQDERGVIKQSGVAMGTTSNVDHWPEILGLLLLQNGAKLNEPTGPLAEGALDFYTVFAKDGIWNDTLPRSTVAFANGTVAMILGPSWRVHEIREINPNLKFRVLPAPQLPKNSPDEPDITFATYWAYAVSSKSPAVNESWDVVKFLTSKDSYERLYQNASQTRAFGQPYPRIDMRDLVAADPFVSGFLSLAGGAKSGFLSSRTFDGPTGINSRIITYFETAVNGLTSSSSGTSVSRALTTVYQGVNQVLVDYGLAAPIAPVE